MVRSRFTSSQTAELREANSSGDLVVAQEPALFLPGAPGRPNWPARLSAGYARIIERYESLGRGRPLAFAILTTAILFGLVFVIFTPGFDTNDDAVMNMVVAGKGYGLAPDEHMVFTHVLIGFVLKSLYAYFPSCPWYGGYLCAVNYAAQTIMLYCVIRGGYTRLRLRLYLAYFTTAGLYLVNNLQFTITALLAGQSGILLLMLVVRRAPQDRRARPWLWCTTAFLLLVLASLIRREAFYPVIGLAIVTCGALALAGRRPLRDALLVGAVAAAALATATVGWQLNHAYYQSDPEWRGFYEYNKLRVKFNDEAWVSYTAETAHVFDDVHWSENDFEMIGAWFFDNEELYNRDSLAKVLDGYPWRQARVSAGMMIESLRAVMLDRESLALFLALPLLLYCVERRGANVAVAALSLAASGGLILYLIVFSKTPPSRVYVPTLAFPLAVAACLAHGNRFFREAGGGAWRRTCFGRAAGWRKAFALSPSTYAAAAVILLLCAGVCKGTYHQYRRSRERIKGSTQLYEHVAAMQPSDDKLFVCWGSSFPFEDLRPFDNLEWMKNLRLVVIGWPQSTPLHARMKKRFAIGDLAEAMFRRTDLYLVAHSYYLGFYEQYVREHFGAELVYQTRSICQLFSVTQARERRAAGRDERAAAPTQPTRTN